MSITTVKIKGKGYLVNGTHSVGFDPHGNIYKQVQEWIVEGNTPDPEFTQADLNTIKAAEERAWRDAQYAIVREGINRLDDSHASGKSNIAQWRLYRNALRDYPQELDFPNGVRPTAGAAE